MVMQQARGRARSLRDTRTVSEGGQSPGSATVGLGQIFLPAGVCGPSVGPEGFLTPEKCLQAWGDALHGPGAW